MNKNYTSYETYDEYIKYLCTKNNTTLLKVAADLELNYMSLITSYKRQRLRIKTAKKLIDYLNGDFDILTNLPLKNEL